jgi:NAD(P)-dependent dehydrogenase (short-subunit alcohol dehydrogenase family)
MDNQPVVLVTGALTGIGRATAIAFAREKASVVVSGRRVEEGQQLAGELRSLGAQAEFMRSDVRFEDDVRKLVDDTVARFGRLDVAVNAAGTEGEPAPVTEQTSERYAAVFDTNVLGTLLAMKHELRVMAAQGSGSIVNISSTIGVRVNAVAPGPVETAMLKRLTESAERKAALLAGVPLKRAGTPEEMADAIVFVASSRSSFMTGEILRINGGKTAT